MTYNLLESGQYFLINNNLIVERNGPSTQGVRGNNKIMLSEYKDQVYSEENTQRKSLRVTSN